MLNWRFWRCLLGYSSYFMKAVQNITLNLYIVNIEMTDEITDRAPSDALWYRRTHHLANWLCCRREHQDAYEQYYRQPVGLPKKPPTCTRKTTPYDFILAIHSNEYNINILYSKSMFEPRRTWCCGVELLFYAYFMDVNPLLLVVQKLTI